MIARSTSLLAATFALVACAATEPPPSPPPSVTPPAPPAAAPAPTPAPAAPPTPPAPGTTPASTPEAPRASTLTKRAEACLDDLACPAAEASRLFIAADDAHEEEDCLRFLEGVGTKVDAARARACFERDVGGHGCDTGEGAYFERAELAVLRIDGTGGPQDLAGARALFEGCRDDVTKSQVMDHAAAKERKVDLRAMDFCRDAGGTTLVHSSCLVHLAAVDRTRAALRNKGVAATLDDEGRRLFVLANLAYEAYVEASGHFVYETFIEGSVRGAAAATREHELRATRTSELAHFAAFVARDVSADDLASAERMITVALSKVATATADERKALERTQITWAAYREAEVGFYVHTFGPKQGPDKVRTSVLFRADRQRAKECDSPSVRPPG